MEWLVPNTQSSMKREKERRVRETWYLKYKKTVISPDLDQSKKREKRKKGEKVMLFTSSTNLRHVTQKVDGKQPVIDRVLSTRLVSPPEKQTNKSVKMSKV